MMQFVNAQKQEIKLVREEIEKVKAENEQMKSELKEIGTPAYLEKLARKEYGMIKEGEQIIVLEDANKER